MDALRKAANRAVRCRFLSAALNMRRIDANPESKLASLAVLKRNYKRV